MDPNVKQVKVDNWGIYFLQRLKHFFNRTDYCDLTLQFQDNAQLKVHRLVLSACTEYFELLERTCEMYEDCLVMPDDLQADVVVPIVNFMYTGQLEFHMDSLERLYQTSQVMNMPVLTKLLESHRVRPIVKLPTANYGSVKRPFSKSSESFKKPMKAHTALSTSTAKRSYTKAFVNVSSSAGDSEVNNGPYISSTPVTLSTATPNKKVKPGEPRPTRYDLPEELDGDIFDDSFSNISYASEPLMVHPETVKRYPSKKSTNMFAGPTSSKRSSRVTSVMDIMESKKILKTNNIFEEDSSADLLDEQTEMFQPVHVKKEKHTVSEHIFDQMMDIPDFSKSEGTGTPKVTIETKNANQAGNIDHAKIISEVLKKYPHLMKSKKNIKLKILNTPTTPNILTPNILKTNKKPKPSMACMADYSRVKTESNSTFESDVLNSQEAAKLIAMGPENVKGPWICLICGTPGRALHFSSYYQFRRHLVEVHKEKPTLNICEYCGLKSGKRNYMLHHLYTKHGVEPPPAYRFPKCNSCNYVALTEALLVKHKNSHIENRTFRCYVCPATFDSSSELLMHIQTTGHKYSSERKTNLQCIYCLKVFLRESNLFAHIKANHKGLAIQDGIIDDSDDENRHDEVEQRSLVKFEPPSYDDYEGPQTEQYEIRPDGNIELVSRKQPTPSPTKQKILNAGYINTNQQASKPIKKKPVKKIVNEEFHQEVSISPPSHNEHEEVVMIDNNEYVVKGNQLVLRKKADHNEQYILSDIAEPEDPLDSVPPMEFADVNDTVGDDTIHEQQAKLIKNPGNMNQSLIVVSNEEEYKALMNANHSIIFDDSEANKTLTVLSTPHGATLTSTSMNLADAQPSDMMVIQEDYPLAVSEAMPADNNIMVVYSHQNKPYQIISSQGLGGQYVQSSAVVTQNFEAITGSTPVVTDHRALIIDTQQAGSWHGNISTDQEMVNAGSEVQELSQMAIVEPAEITAVAEHNDSMNELPDVTLQVVTMEENSQSSPNADNTPGDTSQQVEPENEADSAMNIDESGQEPLSEQTPEESIADEAVEDEHNLQAGADEDKINEETAAEEPTEEQAPNETESADITGNAETAHESIEIENVSMQVEEQMQDRIETQSTLVDNGVVASEEVSKSVEPFISEWSEDEYDTNEENVNPQEKDGGDEAVTDQGQVEETIENIQQEMDKQMCEADTVDQERGEENADTEESESQEVSKHDHDGQDQIEASEDTAAPPEKISSILNDWDDNDSQEDNEAVDGNEDETLENHEINDENIDHAEHEKGSEKTEPIKEKLKSLVSDWDEDE